MTDIPARFAVRGSLVAFALATAVTMLAACGSDQEIRSEYPSDTVPVGTLTEAGQTDSFGSTSLFGGDGLSTSLGYSGGGPIGGVGVNGYLWRGALDTLSFMPLTSADPFGGVIISDWYTPPEASNERFKVNAFILDRTLRTDGIRIAVFHQTRRGADWVDVPVSDTLALDLENAVLNRARQLRLRSAAR